jgi:predicted RND superfamily exporter protein
MYFGLLLSISMVNCLISTLLILPSFFVLKDKIAGLLKKWLVLKR